MDKLFLIDELWFDIDLSNLRISYEKFCGDIGMNKFIFLDLCPVCGMKPFIIGSSPAYTIMGNDKCPLCKQVCSTETDIFKCYELWNRVVENFN